MVKPMIAAILLLPLLEIAAFAGVAAFLGLGWALILMLATTAAGALILRRAGRTQFAHLRVAATDTAGITGIEADAGGIVTTVAGVLLFIPGFITDLVGLALLIGPVRRAAGRAFRSWLNRRHGDPSVVELAPEEWRNVPDRELPDRSSREN